MKNNIEFNIESLLHGFENPKGPIVQVMFANKVAKHEGFEFFNRIARVTFDDSTVNSTMPGSVPLLETILLGYVLGDAMTLHLCIRGEKSVCRIATGYLLNRDITIHKEYRQAILLKKLQDNAITQIFNHIWDNPETIEPVPKIFKY